MKSKCWLYKGTPEVAGYARITMRGKRFLVHRVAYQLFKGQIRYGQQLDHLCRVRNCFNPAHLEAVTARVNALRGYGACAINARKKTCKNGHRFTLNNTSIRNQGKGRSCRKCNKVDQQNRWKKEK